MATSDELTELARQALDPLNPIEPEAWIVDPNGPRDILTDFDGDRVDSLIVWNLESLSQRTEDAEGNPRRVTPLVRSSTREPMLARGYLDQRDEADVQRERAEIAERRIETYIVERDTARADLLSMKKIAEQHETEADFARRERDEARAQVTALRESISEISDNMIPIVNAVSFLEGGGARWADRLAPLRHRLRNLADTALTSPSGGEGKGNP